MESRRYLTVSAALLAAAGFCLSIPSQASAQGDQTKLRINEVLTSNDSTYPADSQNQFEDMVEIYNPSDENIRLANLIITDTVTKDAGGKLHPAGTPWKFIFGSILAKCYIMVYCDGDVGSEGNGQPHTSFKLNQGGGIVALFGPGDVLIDLVAVPRLAQDTSYGRNPDNPDTFCHMAVPSFRKCNIMVGGCDETVLPNPKNNPCSNIAPEIDLHAFTSIADASGANPKPGQAVPLIAEVWDEKENSVSIDKVSVIYQVDGGTEIETPMELDAEATAQIMMVDYASDPTGATLVQNKNRSIWRGEIPGQPEEGSLVTFHLKVVDKDGLTGTDPKLICGVPATSGCKKPFRYLVGYDDQGPLVLNEIAPWNTMMKIDPSDSKAEDYIEIYSSVDLNLEGYCLSANPFRPDEWKFTAGANIKAGGHLIVYCDNDWGKPGVGLYHTNFKLSREGGVIYIFDKDAEATGNRMGMIDGYKYGIAQQDVAFSRCPDGDRASPFVLEVMGSPDKATDPDNCGMKFTRGDGDDSGGIDISDPMYILTFMYLGGETPHCLRALDADGTGVIDINDPVFVLAYMYFAGLDPPHPFPACGVDTAPGELTCESFSSCSTTTPP